MSSLKAEPTMTQVKSNLLDGLLMLDSIQSAALDSEMPPGVNEDVVADTSILRDILNRAVEVINAWEKAQPTFHRTQEAVRLDAGNRR